MERSIEFLLELIAELFVDLIGEGILEVILRHLGFRTTTNENERKFSTVIGYAFFGVFVGGISLGIHREHLITDPTIRTANLVIAPLLIGTLMSFRGKSLKKRDKIVVGIDTFWNAYAFCLALNLVRYFWGV